VARGSVARGSVARGSVARGSVARRDRTIKAQVSIRSQFIDTDDKIAGERKDSGQLREDKKDVNNVVAFAYLNEPKCRTCRSFDAW
jgi:hypothetical protein